MQSYSGTNFSLGDSQLVLGTGKTITNHTQSPSLKHFNDFDISSNGQFIVLSEPSIKFTDRDCMLAMLEHSADGRLMETSFFRHRMLNFDWILLAISLLNKVITEIWIRKFIFKRGPFEFLSPKNLLSEICLQSTYVWYFTRQIRNSSWWATVSKWYTARTKWKMCTNSWNG